MDGGIFVVPRIASVRHSVLRELVGGIGLGMALVLVSGFGGIFGPLGSGS